MTMLGAFELNKIYTGDAQELAQGIPDESVDLIACDPVYWQIEDYKWLAHEALRILKPGGDILAQCGSEFRYNAESEMMIDGLIKRPLLIELYTGGFMQMWNHRSLNAFSPYIWMSKNGSINRETWVHSAVKGGGKDKSIHEWGDSSFAFMRWIEDMTSTCAVVLDPFTGGGTVPAVCKMLGRNYLAFEINPETAERARQRVAQTQPPLFVLQSEQLSLGGIGA